MDWGSLGNMAAGGFGMGGGVAAIAVGLALIVFALFSYKIYKVALFFIGGGGGGFLGWAYLLPIINESLAEPLEWVPYVVTIVCGIIGIVLILALQKLAIFVSGAFLGFMIGSYVSIIIATTNPEFGEGLGKWLVSIAAAILVGFLAGFIFRPVFIISTSLVCCVGGGLCIAGSFGLEPLVSVVVGVSLGVVMSVLAMIFQFKTTGKKKKEKE